MQISLSREQYDKTISELLGRLFTDPQQLQAAWKSQYPKYAVLAESELQYRGIEPPQLAGKTYSREQLDAMIECLEGVGQLTEEAKGAARLHVTLAEYRRRYGDPLENDKSEWSVANVGGKLLLEIPCGQVTLEDIE